MTVPTPRRPILPGNQLFESLPGAAADPAKVAEVAHRTAELLVRGARSTEDAEVVARVVKLADDYGLDELADLWSDAPADSLPGTLWRLYVLRSWVHSSAEDVAREYATGREYAEVHAVVAGVADPPGPGEVRAMVDAVLRGVASGDFATTLDRAAAFARIVATGRAHLADIARRVQQSQREYMIGLVRAGQADGSIRGGLDAEALGLTVNAALEGFLVQQLEPPAVQRRWVAKFRTMIEEML